MENIAIFSKIESTLTKELLDDFTLMQCNSHVNDLNTSLDYYNPLTAVHKEGNILISTLECIKVSACHNYVAGVNFLKNELSVYRYGTNGIPEDVPCFNPSLTSTNDVNVIVGWDKAHLGKSHGLSAEENVALLQPPTCPLTDSERCNLAWSRFQSDETFLCVNTYTPTLKRFISVFDVLHGRFIWSWHESAYRHKLGDMAAWRPRFNQLAVPFQSGDGHYIGIWERGALVRGLPLGLAAIPVRGLEFSTDGLSLFIWQQGDAEGGFVAIYLHSNGGWLLKQQLRVFGESLVEVAWACAVEYQYFKTSTIELVHKNGGRLTIQWGLRPDVSTDGELVLINGRFINITRMNAEVLPPGACSMQLELPAPSTCANKVFLHETEPRIAVLCDLMYLHLYDRLTGAVLLQRPIDMRSQRLINDVNIWEFVEQFFQSGQSVALSNDSLDNVIDCGLSTYRQICSIRLLDGKVTFRLEFNGNLSIDDVVVSKMINSLCLDTDYLFLTAYKTMYYFHVTNDNLAQLLNKCRLEFGINGPPSVEAFAIINLPFIKQRPVEINAKLLTASVAGLVMIMPRGNFELIQIPEIGGRKVEKLMSNGKYKEAVSTVHLLNLDPNVLIDNDINRFVENAANFVKVVDEQSLVHLLIELKDHPKHDSKRRTVCTAIHDSLLASGSFSADSLPLLALTRLQMCSSQLSSAIPVIIYIGTFVQQSVKRAVDEHIIRTAVENTLRVLQTASKQDITWFHFAVRIGQLEVASMIASYLRMDPKVYEPFLADIKRYADDKLLYQHHVNKYLGNDKEALKTLFEWHNTRDNTVDDTNVVLAFVRERKLGRKSMDCLINSLVDYPLYRRNVRTLITALSADVAAELSKEGDHIYNSYANALYRRNTYVPEPMTKVQVTWNTDNWQQDLQTQLSSESAICYLVDDDQFKAAASIASAADRDDLIETVVFDGIAKRADYLLIRMNKLISRYTQMYHRLMQVRIVNLDRSQLIQHIEGDDGDDNNVFDDTASMATTTASTTVTKMSSSSASSTRRRQRRDARKADKIREGHPREDINIMRVLYEDIHFVFEQTSLLTQLFEMKICHPASICRDVDSLIGMILKMQTDMKKNAKDIWPDDLNLHFNPSVSDMNEMQIRRIVSLQQSLNFLEMKFRSPPENMKNIFKTINSENE